MHGSSLTPNGKDQWLLVSLPKDTGKIAKFPGAPVGFELATTRLSVARSNHCGAMYMEDKPNQNCEYSSNAEKSLLPADSIGERVSQSWSSNRKQSGPDICFDSEGENQNRVG